MHLSLGLVGAPTKGTSVQQVGRRWAKAVGKGGELTNVLPPWMPW